MTIEMLLDLRIDMMGEAEAALVVLREAWEERKRPTERQGLIEVLRMTLDRCKRRSVTYPRGFLMRKGQLQRGEFQPRQEIRSLVDPAAVQYTAEGHQKIPQEWIRQAVEVSVREANAGYGKSLTHGSQVRPSGDDVASVFASHVLPPSRRGLISESE